MDAIIRQTVREEIRRQGESASTSSEAPTRQPNQRTVSRLSGLLDRIRAQSRGKKRKSDKEHRIQVRWIHYDKKSEVFVPVRQKKGGGNRFVAYTASEPPTVEELKQKATVLFFPDGKSAFAGSVDDMLLDICDTTQTAIIRFPGEGTIESYLKENGLYPSTTYLYLRSQHQDTFFSQRKADEEKFERPVNLNTSQVASDAGKRVVCSICSCTYLEGEECIRCEQNREYEFSRIADGGNPYTTETPETPETPVLLTMDEIRSRRVALLSNGEAETEAEGSHDSSVADETSYPTLTNDENCNRDEGSVEPNNPCPSSSRDVPERILTVHRSCIRTGLIEHFKDPSVMNCNIDFKVINKKGEFEKGVGVGVICEVYTLFWSEFSISMTIGERERVPFVRHDHFVEEWEAVGRILVKGFVSVSYFPTFLSKAFLCYCLFGNQVPDSMFVDSFTKYLSPVEEEFIVDIIRKNQLPDDEDELTDFLGRFKCRRVVTTENLSQVILEISKQELVQKPHLMISSLRPFVQQLKQYPEFQTISAVEGFYDSLKPTTKRGLSCLTSNPQSEGERDAFKFLQRFVRGLEMPKLLQFLRFTTAMDIMIDKKIEVTFIKCEGLSARPIAHTCGPLLEIPSTYANYVELREDFMNILNRDNWEMDII